MYIAAQVIFADNKGAKELSCKLFCMKTIPI